MTWRLRLDPGPILALGPSLYWALDAQTGATDLSGNGRNGTGTGDITIGGYSDGPLAGTDSATDFDGSDDRITSTYNPFQNGTVRTFMGWAWRDTSSSVDVLFAADVSGSVQIKLLSGVNTLQFAASTTGTDWTGAWPGNGQWVHWAIVFNEPADTAALYLNGALVSSQAKTDAYAASPGNLEVAARVGTTDPFNGKMAHVAVWERGLTADEVRSVYEAQRTTSILNINDGTDYRVREPLEAPMPARDSQYASSASTEGDSLISHRYQNRTIQCGMWVFGSSQSDLLANLNALSRKIDKLNREGGELEITTPAGTVVVFDVIGAEIDTTLDNMFGAKNRAQVALSFEAKPFGRGISVLDSDRTETTNPALVFAVSGVEGDVPALGKLVIDEDQAQDQWFVVWGVESRHFDTADPTNKRLLLEAENLTLLSTSALFGATVTNNDLTPTYQAILSTQLSGGSHLGHVGTYRVWARILNSSTNTGAVDAALEWAEGDFRRFTRNDPVSWAAGERLGVWRLCDLGLVHLSKVAQGTQRWEGRIIARSTVAGDDIAIDWLLLVPVAEGYGEVRGALQIPSLVAARDEFNQASAAFTATAVMPIGGTWSRITGATDDAEDFTINTANDYLQRTAVSDANTETGRYAVAGTTDYVTVRVRADVDRNLGTSSTNLRQGVFARLVDINNWLMAVVYGAKGLTTARGLAVYMRSGGGAPLLLGETEAIIGEGSGLNAWLTLELSVTAAGTWQAAAWSRDNPNRQVALEGYNSALGRGGALATGRVGIYDVATPAGAVTRLYDNFVVHSAGADAAIFASQSLEIRHDRVIREDSTGALWTPVSDYQGDYLTIPPSGQEGRQARIVVKASRNLPESGADTGVDDISARLTITPRYLQLPD